MTTPYKKTSSPKAEKADVAPVKTPLLPSAKVQFLENLFAALRTAGALLVGNSALIYFGIVGAHPEAYARPLWYGLGMFVFFALPVAVIERNTYAARALKSTNRKGN